MLFIFLFVWQSLCLFRHGLDQIWTLGYPGSKCQWKSWHWLIGLGKRRQTYNSVSPINFIKQPKKWEKCQFVVTRYCLLSWKNSDRSNKSYVFLVFLKLDFCLIVQVTEYFHGGTQKTVSECSKSSMEIWFLNRNIRTRIFHW